METIDLDSLCNEVLTLVESQEGKLLSWGFMEVATNLDNELPSLIDNLPEPSRMKWIEAQALGITTQTIVNNLMERRLLFPTRRQGQYRTRFSETVRLLFLLRQRFNFDDWQSAPRLVSDLKLWLQRRQYPCRDIEAHTIVTELETLGVSRFYRDAVLELLKDPDGELFQLACFQKDAILQQINDLRARSDRALVVGAGTGSGKTKAFYVPALAHVATYLKSQQFSVQILALYPRVELLKDQLNEALSEARKLDQLLSEKRPLIVGAYYADTPKRAHDFLGNFPPSSWENLRSGWQPPFVVCPNGQDHELVWQHDDLMREQEANSRGEFGRYALLQCQTCGFSIGSDHLLLTREQMIRTPPDVLFTTTEMLNRRLARAREHRLFGVGNGSPPRLVLLDEIHTYEGLNGAQIAYLLRRWRHMRGNGPNVCFVGLSATLTQAILFFSSLTGVPEYHVHYISPRIDDLIEEGIEYNIVLKGDPVASTALLSTSVQAAMLLGRILDPLNDSPSRGAFGHKIFAFSDKLDVINRWFHIQDDAERLKLLSQYRIPPPDLTTSQLRARFADGQIWDLCERIGHDLLEPMQLERTTSLDRGVNPNVNMVIATSTLEVGFNDPAVGAVMQHKAPRSMASFLQRKGRAGRRRSTRPWTMVITSDYGRDRWAFQHAETLFQPLLPPLELPLKNYYVLKIQATFALMDWVAYTLRVEGQEIDVWWSLTNRSRDTKRKEKAPQRDGILSVLRDVQSGLRFESLRQYLLGALNLHGDLAALDNVLWGEPRALVFEVIPTLVRQLESRWQQIRDEDVVLWQDSQSSYPLPDFVPPNLFTDLNLPEVTLFVPDLDQEPTLALPLALTEFTPGKVNKRFSGRHDSSEAHWIPLPRDLDLNTHWLPLDHLKQYIDWDPLVQNVIVNDQECVVYRPRTYRLARKPANMRDTSDARFLWKTHIVPRHDLEQNPANLLLGMQTNLGQFFLRIEVLTQATNTWADVTRLAVGVMTDTRIYGQDTQRRMLYLSDVGSENHQAALGFQVAADALRFICRPFDPTSLREHPSWLALYRNIGPQYFGYRLRHHRRLIALGLSSFEIDRLHELQMAMLISTAVQNNCTLPEAAPIVEQKGLELVEETLRIIFQSQQVDPDTGEEEVGRLHDRLLTYMQLPDVQLALVETQTLLWQTDAQLDEWLKKLYSSSVGASVFTAITSLIPDMEPDDLLMDIEEDTIWITETVSGGVGLISKIADAIAQRPRHFELQFVDTIEHCDRSYLASQLRTVAGIIASENQELREAFESIRQTSDLQSLNKTKNTLINVLQTQGVPATRSLFVALNARFLRPNSNQASDALITELVEQWEAEQVRLGCAIDLRIFSTIATYVPSIRSRIEDVFETITGETPPSHQIHNLLQSLLWSDCDTSCPACIEHYLPYQWEPIRPSRHILRMLLKSPGVKIDFAAPYWAEMIRESLASGQTAIVSCHPTKLAACKIALQDLLTAPIEAGYQIFYPVVESIVQDDDQLAIYLVLREIVGR